jgi:mono/diheme cytochrome c family protein
VAPVTTTQAAVPTGLAFLPTTPNDFPYGMAALTNCSDCHGVGLYAQSPMAPSWNGSLNGALLNVGIYNVVAGSIQDHTGLTDDQCLTCHTPV